MEYYDYWNASDKLINNLAKRNKSFVLLYKDDLKRIEDLIKETNSNDIKITTKPSKYYYYLLVRLDVK